MDSRLDAASEQCSAIAFYGICPDTDGVRRFYEMVVEWFTSLDCPPDKLSIRGPGHGSKLTDFASGDSRLRTTGFEKVNYFELVSSTPDAVTGHDFFLEAACECGAEETYAIVVARSSLGTLSSTSLLPIARKIFEALRPAYGIGYTRDHRHGPEFYAIGIGYGRWDDPVLTGDAYEQARNVSRWSDMGMVHQVWCDGVLRDVYPWNFLTKPQLTKQIGAMPLEKWIQSGAGRGKIERFCGDISFWELKEYEIPSVRAALWDAGAIFDWRKIA